MRFLVSVPIIALVASTPASACPVMTKALRPIATKNVTMLPDGGVLLGTTSSYGNKRNGAYSLVDETGTAIDATEEQVAPGLFRLTPKQHADRDLSMAEDGKTIFNLQDAAGAPPLAVVPKLGKVTATRNSTQRNRYPTIPTTTITLASAPPSNIIGIVLYGSDSMARAWLPTNKGKRYQLSFGGKGCNSVGMSGAMIGENVMFAFVDSGGRVSPRSKPVRVGVTPPPPKPPTPPVTQPPAPPVSKSSAPPVTRSPAPSAPTKS